MKTVLPVSIIIVAMMLMCCVSTSIIAFDLQVAAARNFHTEAMDRLQASYYSDTVNNEVMKSAQEHGYDLDVTVDMGSVENGGRMTAKVELGYTAKMPFFGIQRNGTIVGIAR